MTDLAGALADLPFWLWVLFAMFVGGILGGVFTSRFRVWRARRRRRP